MKKLIFTICAICGLISFAASPTFVTKRMLDRRNGLTDEQYEYLWSIGANPQISRTAARDWVFRANRYQNVTNWLDICGKTNDFARLAFSLQDQLVPLASSNRVLQAAARTAASLAESFSNACVTARNEADAHSNRLAKITAFLSEKKSAAKLSSTKAIYQAIIDKLNE